MQVEQFFYIWYCSISHTKLSGQENWWLQNKDRVYPMTCVHLFEKRKRMSPLKASLHCQCRQLDWFKSASLPVFRRKQRRKRRSSRIFQLANNWSFGRQQKDNWNQVLYGQHNLFNIKISSSLDRARSGLRRGVSDLADVTQQLEDPKGRKEVWSVVSTKQYVSCACTMSPKKC